jgi:hypothetical protein
MKDRNYIPGPAKALYGIFLGTLAVVLYTGFNHFHPFLSGWRYPWGMGLARDLNFHAAWFLGLTAVVYLYYATLGRPKTWKEPLGIFRILIALLTIWFFLLTYAVYRPYGWLSGMVSWIGGVAATFKTYEIFLWVMLLATVIYLYARWAKSERFPRLTASGARGEVV